MSRLDTNAVHLGREDLAELGVHVPPIDLSTTYPLPTRSATVGAAYERLATGGRARSPATRWSTSGCGTPTSTGSSAPSRRLETCAGAVAFATGMAALSAVLVASVAAGTPHVVGVRPLYGGTDHVLASGLLGTGSPGRRPDRIAEAIRPDTGLVIVETPANPTVDLVDIAAVVAAAGDVPVPSTTPSPRRCCSSPAHHGAALGAALGHQVHRAATATSWVASSPPARSG